MTIKKFIKQNGWQIEADSIPCRSMVVDVDFENSECCNGTDETQFTISAYDVKELDLLFTDFCKENGLNRNSVTSVTVVQFCE